MKFTSLLLCIGQICCFSSKKFLQKSPESPVFVRLYSSWCYYTSFVDAADNACCFHISNSSGHSKFYIHSIGNGEFEYAKSAACYFLVNEHDRLSMMCRLVKHMGQRTRGENAGGAASRESGFSEKQSPLPHGPEQPIPYLL